MLGLFGKSGAAIHALGGLAKFISSVFSNKPHKQAIETLLDNPNITDANRALGQNALDISLWEALKNPRQFKDLSKQINPAKATKTANALPKKITHADNAVNKAKAKLAKEVSNLNPLSPKRLLVIGGIAGIVGYGIVVQNETHYDKIQFLINDAAVKRNNGGTLLQKWYKAPNKYISDLNEYFKKHGLDEDEFPALKDTSSPDSLRKDIIKRLEAMPDASVNLDSFKKGNYQLAPAAVKTVIDGLKAIPENELVSQTNQNTSSLKALAMTPTTELRSSTAVENTPLA